jgi:hypothetical protein
MKKARRRNEGRLEAVGAHERKEEKIELNCAVYLRMLRSLLNTS